MDQNGDSERALAWAAIGQREESTRCLLLVRAAIEQAGPELVGDNGEYSRNGYWFLWTETAAQVGAADLARAGWDKVRTITVRPGDERVWSNSRENDRAIRQRFCLLTCQREGIDAGLRCFQVESHHPGGLAIVPLARLCGSMADNVDVLTSQAALLPEELRSVFLIFALEALADHGRLLMPTLNHGLIRLPVAGEL